MRHFSVVYQHGSQEYEVVLEEVPWWAYAVSEAADGLCSATHHLFCQFLGDALFFADNRSRSLYRFPVSAKVADALGARLPEYEEYENESTGIYDGPADSTGT